MSAFGRRRNQVIPKGEFCCIAASSSWNGAQQQVFGRKASFALQAVLLSVLVAVILPAFVRLFRMEEMGEMKDLVHITYPENVTENASKPVIYLFGWAGASDVKMSKYSQMYTKHGYTTVKYTAPWNYIFINNEKTPEAVAKVVDFVNGQSDIKSKDKVFHVFSNLGCSVYQHFTQEFLKNGTSESFKGIIFDSCPGKRAAPSFFNSMEFVLGGNVLRRKIIPLFYFFYLIGKSIGRGIAGKEDPTFWWEYLQDEDPIRSPQLYLYSAADICVNPDHTKEMASNRNAKQNITVQEHDFKDSHHVSHFDKYPEEYEKICIDFLNSLE